MEIVFLGTGGSFPSPQRGVSSIAIKVNGDVLLFDCGEGTQRQLMRSQLSFMSITKIFITHFHGDHYLGLPGLLQTMALNGRTKDLEIFGPKGTEQLVTILERISYYSRTFDLVLHELKDGQVEHFEGFDVLAHRLDHSLPCLGYYLVEDDRQGKFDMAAAKLLEIPEGPLFSRLQAGETIVWNGKGITPEMVMGPPRPGRKVFIAMDTKPIMGLPEIIEGADVLIHEATADHSLEEKANKFGHSTAAQAATIAKEAGVRKLFMVHISPRYKDAEPLLKEARSIFAESYLPNDLDLFSVPYPEVTDEELKKVAEAAKEEAARESLERAAIEKAERGEDVGKLVDELEATVTQGEEATFYSDPAAAGASASDGPITVPPPPAKAPTQQPAATRPPARPGTKPGTKPIAKPQRPPKGGAGTFGPGKKAPAQGGTEGGDDEEDDIDLDRAMLEAGIDPDAEEEEG
jgi:ribonuclease Z